MRSHDRHIGHSSRRSSPPAARYSLIVIVAAAIGLAGCGGSTPKHPSTHAVASVPTVSTPTTTTATTVHIPAKPAHQSGHPGRAHSKAHPAAVLTGTPVQTTIAPTSTTRSSLGTVPHAPKYRGPSPIYCLRAAGLNRARLSSVSTHVWQANFGHSRLDNGNAIVFLSGPFETDAAAQSFAQPMQTSEFTATGGPWVASAARTSGLGSQVSKVAACMGSRAGT